MVRIDKQIFIGKQHIRWRPDVEQYLKRYIGKSYYIKETADLITIPSEFPDEYTGSSYTKKLRGSLAKVKANAAQVIDELVVNAENRRESDNKSDKHSQDASLGWLRYDTFFEVCVKGEEEREVRWNRYRATLVVRVTERGRFLYDMINIKKEARRPL
ncbi:MAG: hypothetical protein J5829_08070 [Lachnospiraceae bacterium]|nr:hypothetical protein [Lachnospiraceae bacterium]